MAAHRSALAAAAVLTALAAPAMAQDASRQTGAAPGAPLDALFARWNRTDGPGCAVGVDQDGVSQARAVYGLAELEHAVPARIDTVYEAGSVSKQFTAAAIVLLADEGRLSLDDDVRRYIPELPDYGATITLRMLLEHTSGLRDWGALVAQEGWPRGTRAVSNAYIVTLLSRRPDLAFAPGSQWSYNNSGYNLAAVVVERVSGESLAAYTRRRLFEPLGMSHTRWRDDFNAVVPGRATAYAPREEGGWRQSMPFENAYGNGGLLTTVDDLMIWNRALSDGFLNLRTRLETRGTAGGRPTGYGLGLSIGDLNGRPEIGHSGSTAGYRAWIARYPEDGLAVVVLCNAADAPAQVLGRDAAGLFPPAPEPGPEPVPTAN